VDETNQFLDLNQHSIKSSGHFNEKETEESDGHNSEDGSDSEERRDIVFVFVVW